MSGGSGRGMLIRIYFKKKNLFLMKEENNKTSPATWPKNNCVA